MIFSEAAELYIKEIRVTKAASTYKGAMGYLRRACNYLGDMECESINKGVILDFIIYLRDINPSLKNATINKYLSFVLPTLTEQTNVKINIKRLREDIVIPQILSDEVIQIVYDYCDSLNSEEGIRNKLMFMTLHDSGMRISEVLRMRVKDINFQSRMIHVTQTKNGFNRYTLFTEETSELLERFIISNRITEHIFINLETRTVLHPDSIQTICQRIQEKTEINQSITPHKWRHTFASNFSDKDGNTFVLMKLLGHRDMVSTLRYVHVSMKKIKKEYSKIIESL